MKSVLILEELKKPGCVTDNNSRHYAGETRGMIENFVIFLICSAEVREALWVLRAFSSIFILNYIDDLNLRQAIEKQLNKIESAQNSQIR